MILKSKFSKDKLDKIRLINQIIQFAILEDEKFKKEAIKKNKASQASGESWLVHHLKALKELIEKE